MSKSLVCLIPILSAVLGSCTSDHFPETASGDSNGRPHVLVVLNKADGTASFLEGGTLRILGGAPAGEDPHEAVASPDGRLVYVANYGGGKDGRTVTVLDPARCAREAVIDLGEHRGPHGLALTRDGKTLWVTCEGSGALVAVDTASRKVVRAIPTGDKGSHMVVLTHDERRAFTANMHSDTVSVIDLRKGVLERLVTCEKGPEGIDLAPDGRSLWVGNRAAASVSIVDVKSLAVVGRIAVGEIPIRVRAWPDGGRILVSHYKSEDLRIYDAATRAEIRKMPIGGVPIGILPVPGTRSLAYVARSRAGTVAVVDLDTGETVREAPTGREPDGMTVANR